MNVRLLAVLSLALLVTAEKQCSEGPCCNIAKGTFKSKGSKCSKLDNECHVAIGTCSGFSANCPETYAKNGAKCSTGICYNGSCVSEEKAAIEARTVPETKPETPAVPAEETVVTSGNAIDNNTKSLKVKISSELEKANTLLSSVTISDDAAKEALTSAVESINECIKLQNTDNAEQLTINSSKATALLQVAFAKLKSVLDYADSASASIIEESITIVAKAQANLKYQKKYAKANMNGESLLVSDEERKKENEAKVKELIEKGLPVVTKAVIHAADRLGVLQEAELAKLAAQELAAQKREKMRIIDEELHRVEKKAKSARLNSLRLFEKAESKDLDAQELKAAARNIVDSDPEMKMRYFTGLAKILLESNREKFIARDRKKLPNEEKYADYFAMEHEIIRRNDEALLNSGYFGEKYGRANITLPEESESTQAPSLYNVLIGANKGQKVNLLAVILLIFAGIIVLFIIFAIIGRATNKNEDHKKCDDDEDSYEQF